MGKGRRETRLCVLPQPLMPFTPCPSQTQTSRHLHDTRRSRRLDAPSACSGRDRGYGYIWPDKPGRDLWFHIREGSIAEPAVGMRVTYYRVTDPRTGREAAQVVQLLNEPAPVPHAEQGKDDLAAPIKNDPAERCAKTGGVVRTQVMQDD